ncbi:MAG TPA: ferredoxin [Anaerolineaceae bacterium]|nr:ferredoxin [Anaerolineaceae bacterium]
MPDPILSEGSFSIEFQPVGIRLICSEPITLLDAARQAGIQLQNVCGGKGICGKCAIQIIEGESNPPTRSETTFLKGGILKEGERLACETTVHDNVKIFIPPTSLESKQRLQTEGRHDIQEIQSPIHCEPIHLNPPSLTHPIADLRNLLSAQPGMYFENDERIRTALQTIPAVLRNGNWDVYAVCNQNEILNILPEKPAAMLGLAVDVGSTKIACFLMDLPTGKTMAVKGIPNPQIAYGEDIMARLEYALQNDAQAAHLHSIIIEAINEVINSVCHEAKVKPQAIMDFCFVGNTAMHHFFLDLPSKYLASAPFTMMVDQALNIPIDALGIQGMPGSKAYFPAPIAGFVGSDHLAFLLSSGFGDDQHTRLGIDIGTNTEIAIQKGDRIVSCSTASGPAFEGAHIRFGMRAAPGAIEHVRIDPEGNANVDVIGGGEAIGICGSGILDVIAELKQRGILNQRGRLDREHAHVSTDDSNMRIYTLIPPSANQREITISQKDIDQILLAKGAIRSGIAILMDYLKVKDEDIAEVIIAGAFGSYLNPQHAIQIGMLPDLPLHKISAVGNAAGAGAKMMLLSSALRQKGEQLAKQIEHLELNTYPDFDMFFANGIRFS